MNMQISFPKESGIARHRVTAERAELDEKISRISELIGSPQFKLHDPQERNLVIEQLEYMQKYSLILARRLLLY